MNKILSIFFILNCTFSFALFQVSLLTEIPGSPFTTETDPQGLAFSPNGLLLAVANAGFNNVTMFDVTPSRGFLTEVLGSPFAASFGSLALAFSPGGTFLTVINNSNSNISVYKVDTRQRDLAQALFEKYRLICSVP